MNRKFTLQPFFFFLLLISTQTFSQNNTGFQWQRYFGGTKMDGGSGITKTNDGGFIVVGTTTSSDGDVGPGSRDSGDVWLVKFNATGAIQWKKTYGGNGQETGYKVIQTNDGGYAICGTTSSNNGDVSGNKGWFDIWVFKVNVTGVLQWQRCLGGSLAEIAYGITEAADGGIVVTGETSSNNGDVTGKTIAGNKDIWTVKLNSAGSSVVWQKVFLAAKQDVPYDISRTADGGFIITGATNSNDGDFAGNGTANQGYADMFLVKLSSTGATDWKRMYHSQQSDFGYSVLQTADNGYIVAASRNSYDSLSSDYGNAWIVKTNSTGDISWQKSVVHPLDTASKAFDVVINAEGDGYTFAGSALDYQFNSKAWMLGVDLSGNTVWRKRYDVDPASELTGIIDFSDGYFISTGYFFRTGDLPDDMDLLLLKTGPVNIIKGSLYLDVNKNGIKDGAEVYFNNAIVKTQKAGFSVTGQPNNGRFSFDTDTGSYSTTVQFFTPYYNVVPSSKTTSFTNYFNIDSFSFAVQPLPGQQDLVVYLVPLSPARPGFKAQYLLNYKNKGTTTIINGNVKFVKDSRTSLSLSFPLPVSVVADTITWDYNNLLPLDSVSIIVELQLAAPPSININDTLKYTAVVLPVAGDLTPADDTSRLNQLVQGSYDPNDKQESFAGRIPLKNVQDGSYINYVIRFQNTGNDTAFFVRLLDTLDAKLDWSSFQMIGSSHAYNLTIKDGNKLNWFFDNIKLPDSTTNLARSIGYVAFRIKPKTNLLANDVIPNKASIYFDYNLPIVTNTTLTTVVSLAPTGVRNIQNNEMKLLLGPNPNSGYSLLQISGKLTGKFELRMMDVNGRVLSQQTITRNSIAETVQLPLNMQKLSAGVYYLQLQQKEKSWWQKVVVQ